MRTLSKVVSNTLLIIGLVSITSLPSFTVMADTSESIKLPIISVQEPCIYNFEAQEIPDDGSWLTICWSDSMAPEGSTITKVHIKYLLDHPQPEQLEIRLSREESSPGAAIWDRGALIQGDKFGEAVDLGIFNGTPSQGNWYFQIRDTKPGDIGKFEAFTIRPVYAPIGPVPAILSGSPGEPTSFRIPADAVISTTPDQDSEKPVDSPGNVEAVQRNLIKTETFEGAFPNTGWTLTDNSNDGREYLWDDDDHRPHNGSRAAWPANGGLNWLDPASNPYPPNMKSWMIYGPFDLSNAASAETSFWLWRQIETSFDSIYFGISHDGIDFTGTSWSGTRWWENMVVDMSGYIEDSSVWVGWLFESNDSVQYEGPWVDDIVISKEVPGTVTVSGTISYVDRNGTVKPASNTVVYLYDNDPGGTDDNLASAYTNSSGAFSFPTRTNWDGDADANTTNRSLDLYLVVATLNANLYPTYHLVTNFASQIYKWSSSVSTDVPDGAIILTPPPIPFSDPNIHAMWIFQDLRRAWETVYNGTSPSINPGSVTVRWQTGVNCYPTPSDCKTRFIPSGPYIFIQDQSAISKDTVVHEVGHNYIYNANGWTYGCSHDIFMVTDINCAWSEGWADFLPLVVNYVSGSGDTCYDKGIGPCSGTPDSSHYNLETHSRNDSPTYFPWGENVEGRVAGSLYDLYDSANEGYDSAYFPPKPLAPIAKIVLQGSAETSFAAFWNSWKASGYNKHHAVRAIYQNTIDYNTLPTMVLPDWNVPHDSSWNNAFSLLSYTSDAESSLSELTWQIVSVSGSNCSVTIDSSKNIDITQTTFPGACNITVRVSDSIGARTDVFRVTVTQASFSDVPASYWAYTQIEKVFANGITSGCYPDPRRYCPTGNVTRAQMAIFLLKGIHGGGYNPPPATGNVFDDVPISYWAAAWIEQLATEGITGGCGGGNYCPENLVTRAQMAVFLLKSKHGASYTPPPVGSSTGFNDVPVTYWAAAWIEQLATEGITGGCGGGNYCPENLVPRDQIAVFMVLTFNLP